MSTLGRNASTATRLQAAAAWQIALIAIGAAVFAAALSVTVDRILAARRRVSAHAA